MREKVCHFKCGWSDVVTRDFLARDPGLSCDILPVQLPLKEAASRNEVRTPRVLFGIKLITATV